MDLSKFKIQICDDSILARKQVKDLLIANGCSSIVEAKDGEETVTIYEKEQPDLVFMDIVMPKLDGVEAVRRIMALNPSAAIIMLSSVGTKGQIKAAIDAGAKDFIQKPFNPEHILEILRLNLS